MMMNIKEVIAPKVRIKNPEDKRLSKDEELPVNYIK
jgi:hypothetical protein